MKVTKLTEDELYDHLDKPFNPPVINDAELEKAFSREWHVVRDRLKSMLQRYGEFDSYGNKDFHIGETLTHSRGISVEVTSVRLVNKRLLPDAQRFLSMSRESYEIDFVFLTEDGIFHVIVSRDECKACCPASLLDQLL